MISRVLSRKKSPLSLYSYKTDLGKKGLSALGVSFGFLTDIDIDSEPFRFMGKTRFDFVGFFKWLDLESYPATVEILTENGEKKYLQGPFRQFLALGVNHLSEGVLLAPQASLSENLLYLSFIKAKEAHHCRMFHYLGRLDKKASLLAFFHHIQAKEITITLKAENKITVDGKWLGKETRSVTLKALPIKARVFALKGF